MNINIVPKFINIAINRYIDEIRKLQELPIIIAIDGHSSCGKSTLSKDLARTLRYRHIDTGAMYRAVTYYFLKTGLDWNEPQEVEDALSGIKIESEIVDNQSHTFLNGVDVEAKIRGLDVAKYVSTVSTISAVRQYLVGQQQLMGKDKAIVMDGRDIGTVVFPRAELKIFMTADIDVRARRRYEEMKAKGSTDDFDTIKNNLMKRDKIDSSRLDSPLKQADDAILLDTSHLNLEEQLHKALYLAFKV